MKQLFFILWLSITSSAAFSQKIIADTLAPRHIVSEGKSIFLIAGNTDIPFKIKPAYISIVQSAIKKKRNVAISYNKNTAQIMSLKLLQKSADSMYLMRERFTSDTEYISKTPLNEEIPRNLVDTIFQYFKNLSCSAVAVCGQDSPKCISFDYKDNGCNYRAHWMRKLLAEKYGYTCRKIFVESPGLLRVISNDNCAPRGNCVYWGWHVAIYVHAVNPDNTKEWLVIDPSLFSSGPVSADDWTAAQRCTCNGRTGRTSQYYTTPPNQNSPNGHLDNERETIPKLIYFCRQCH